jgi:hypothetical protein
LTVKIIEDETRILSPQDAARADEVLAEAARSRSFGQLRYAAHRLVLKLDPDSAQRRKEAARNEAHVRRFREDSGNARMIAREMPADEVLASWQHVEQRALDLRAAGVPGTQAASSAGIDPDALSFTAVLSLVRSHATADGCCKHCGQRPASANDPLAPLTTAILAHPRDRTGRKRTSGRTPAERRNWRTEEATYTITIVPSNLPKTDTCPGS